MASEFKPYDYQAKAIAFAIANSHCYLALPMSAGKTVITLTAIETAVSLLGDCTRVLVVAPVRVAEMVWTTEKGKWQHLGEVTVAACVGDKRQREAALAEGTQVTTIGRENLGWLVKHYGKKWPFDALVWDEASGLKDPGSLRVRAMKAIRKRLKRLILLSGTPAPNGLLDLFAPYFLLDGGERLGKTLGAYREAFFEPDKRDKYRIYTWKLKQGAEAEIHSRIADITYRCEVDLGVEVEHREIPVKVPMAQYRQLEKDFLLPVKQGTVTAANAAVLAGKLLQLTGGCVYDEDGKPHVLHNAKMEALAEVIDSAMGQPVLVMYWFKHELERLRERFPKAVVFDGEKAMKRWQAGQVEILLLHPASAGHGVDGLQAGGAIVVWYSPTWSLELYQQANARLIRYGQKNTVLVGVLVAEGTIDEEVMAVQRSKAAGQDRLLEALKRRIE